MKRNLFIAMAALALLAGGALLAFPAAATGLADGDASRASSVFRIEGMPATKLRHIFGRPETAAVKLWHPRQDLVEGEGMVVTDLIEGSAAQRAGLSRGDIILEADGAPVDDWLALHEVVESVQSDGPITLKVQHGDEIVELSLETDGSDLESLGIVTCGAQPAMIIEEGWAELDGPPNVMELVEGSAAETAGLEPGDRIVSLNGENIESGMALGDAIGELAPGSDVSLGIERGEAAERLDISLSLGAHPDDPERGFLGVVMGQMRSIEMDHALPSMDMQDLKMRMYSDDLEHLPEGVESGLRIGSVVADSPAAAAGLAEGDWIVAVDGEAVTAPAELAELVQALEPNSQLSLTLQSEEAEAEPRELVVNLGRHPEIEGAGWLGVAINGALTRYISPDEMEIELDWDGYEDGDAAEGRFEEGRRLLRKLKAPSGSEDL